MTRKTIDTWLKLCNGTELARLARGLISPLKRNVFPKVLRERWKKSEQPEKENHLP